MHNAAVPSERIELVALDVFWRAEAAGEVITLAMVEQRLEQLAGHRPTCRCQVCGAVRGRRWATIPVRATNVYRVCAAWQRWARRSGSRRARA